MWEAIKCMFGFHDWNEYSAQRWGETVYRRKCIRSNCRAWQRWAQDAQDPTRRKGRWI